MQSGFFFSMKSRVGFRGDGEPVNSPGGSRTSLEILASRLPRTRLKVCFRCISADDPYHRPRREHILGDFRIQRDHKHTAHVWEWQCAAEVATGPDCRNTGAESHGHSCPRLLITSFFPQTGWTPATVVQDQPQSAPSEATQPLILGTHQVQTASSPT